MDLSHARSLPIVFDRPILLATNVFVLAFSSSSCRIHFFADFQYRYSGDPDVGRLHRGNFGRFIAFLLTMARFAALAFCAATGVCNAAHVPGDN